MTTAAIGMRIPNCGLMIAAIVVRIGLDHPILPQLVQEEDDLQ
jgi:hypothetical protein